MPPAPDPQAMGWRGSLALDYRRRDGRTLVHFMERYHVFNPLMRVLLEQKVHHFISKDNDKLVKAGIERGLAAAKHQGVSANA